MLPRIRFRLSPAATLKIIAVLSLYLAVLGFLPPAAAAYRALTGAERIVIAQAGNPAR